MTKPTAHLKHYRPAAGIAIFNAEGQVFLGKRNASRNAKYIWQMPQGGIDAGETAEYAAIRECLEETGISVQMLSPLGEVSKWLCYDLPKNARKRKGGRVWRGQKQRWFAFRFHGTDADINLNYEKPPEFLTYRWGSLQEAADLVVPFKRDVYAKVAKKFAKYEKPKT